MWLAGQDVDVVCDGGLVHLHHRGVLVATHARRHPADKQAAGMRRSQRRRRAATRGRSASAASVTRKVDSSGNVCFAGTSYRVGNKFRRRQVQVAVVGDTVEISVGTELIRTHPSSTTAPANTAPSPTPAADPAASTPPNPRAKCQCRYRSQTVTRVPGLDTVRTPHSL